MSEAPVPATTPSAGKAALLVIDVQRNFFEHTPAVADGLELLSTLGELVARARAAGAPVIYVRNNGAPGEPDAPGTSGWELSPAIPRLSAEPIVDKKKPDAFEGTSLLSLLRTRGIRRVVVCGLQSEFCVQATCRGAAARGFAVTLVSDAHGTYDAPGDGPTALAIIARENAALAAVAGVTLVPAARVNFA